MGIPLGSQFDLASAIPLDSRNVKADLTARDAIPSVARFEGLEVFVVSTGVKYRLEGGILNTHWVLATGSSGSGGVIDTNTTIYVETTGSDTTGDGSIGLPFATVKRALDSIAYYTIANLIIIKMGAGEFAWADDELDSFPTIKFTSAGVVIFRGSYTELVSGITGTEDPTDPFKFNVSSHTFTPDEHKFSFMGNPGTSPIQGPLTPISANGTDWVESPIGAIYPSIFSLDTTVTFTKNTLLNVPMPNASFRQIYFEFPSAVSNTLKGSYFAYCRMDYTQIGENVVGSSMKLEGCLLYFTGTQYPYVAVKELSRCFFYDSTQVATQPPLISTEKLYGIIIEGFSSVFELSAPRSYDFNIDYAIDSDSAIKIKDCDVIFDDRGDECTSFSLMLNKLIIEESAPYLLKSKNSKNINIIINELVGTLAGIHEPTYFHNKLVDPSVNLNISVPGYYGEYEDIGESVILDNGITYLVIGDTAQNRSIHLMYTLQRATAYQEGVIKLLYDGTNVFMYDDFQDNGSALGVVFTADINGTEIRLVATATSTGDTATFKATVKRIMI